METSSYDTVEMENDLSTYVVETMKGSIEEGEMDCEERWTESLCVEFNVKKGHASLLEVLTLTEEQKSTQPDPGEFLHENATDSYYREVAGSVDKPGSNLKYHRSGFLVRQWPLDRAVQRVVPTNLRARIFALGN